MKSNTLRVAVVGSRDFTDRDLMFLVITVYNDNSILPLEIISGGAKGADTLASGIAEELGIPVKVYPASWSIYGKVAGFVRNRLIVEESDALLAFYGPSGETRGTRHSVELARRKGIPFSTFFQTGE